jgi:hypothetical protein
MLLLRDVDHVETCFDAIGDSFNIDPRKVHDLRWMCHGHGNRFGHTQWYYYVMYVKWKLVLVRLGIVLVSVQDMYMVCAKCTIGLEIILDTPDGTPRWRGSSGSLFQSVWR